MTVRRIASLALVFVVSWGCGAGSGDDAEHSATPAPGIAGDPSRDPASDSQGSASDPRPPASSSGGEKPTPRPPGPLFRAEAERGELAGFALDQAVASADGAVTIAPNGGHAGTDPQPTGYHGGSFYNGGTYRYATATSPVFTPPAAFDSVTPSFEASTPKGTWISVKVAARIGGAWTKDYSLGVWASDDATVRRHSVEGQADANGDVDTDTLTLKAPADALRVSVVLFASQSATASPSLRAVSAIATKRGAAAAPLAADKTVWGKDIAVPKRSQMIYPGGGEVWCSPTSTSMLLAYWSSKLAEPNLLETPPDAAKRCYDVVYAGTGNWPFNTAHAASMAAGRMHGMVTRLSSVAELERLVGAGIPVAISVAYQAGELSRSPIPSTAGHLIVVRGIAANGDVVCNDPAFPNDASVTVTYDRAQLTKVWQRSMGTTYVVWPAKTQLPIDPLGAFH